jgi:hypothetical protein
MSEQPGAPAAPARRENVFTHRIGPLPMWGWLAIAAGGLIAWRLYSGKSAAQTGALATTDTSASQVPQFVNQTYVSTTAPGAPGTTPPAGTDGGTPTNPSPIPILPGAQPKPTTTLPGSWSYPAPSGLQAYDLSAKGTRLSWNAVTGPGGQHPNSYTIATYDSKNKLVDQFVTTAGNTNTAEYGKGGKGLARGTYHSNVWANGGPVAPSHATVQYTLKG